MRIIPENVKEIMQKLLDSNFEAYIIGGAVRDYLLDKEPHDYDVFTNATGEQILKIFPAGKVLGGEERQAKILTVIVDGVEVSQFRKSGDRTETGTDLITHQSTCDFTINSIAMDINGEIFDKFHGRHDIILRVVRFVGDANDRIKEDPLRILRGIRFWADFGTFKNMREVINNLDLLDTLPRERIREEFMKILKSKSGIENLTCDNIIYKIIPELEKTKGMNGGQHHDEKVDRHMENAFKESCKITDNTLLRLACFLHDIGKGYTQSLDEYDEQTHFYEHEMEGCKLMEKRLEELKFSKEEIKYVTTLIRLHMYSYKTEPGKKSYIKFFNNLENANIPIEDYIMLIYCDNQGNMSKPRIKFGDFIKGNWLYKKYYEIKYSDEPMTVKDLKIGGKDLIEKFGLKPGPEIGKILNMLFTLVMDGEVKNTRAELLYNVKALVMKE